MRGLERTIEKKYQSKSEKIIANILERRGINFEYEKQVLVEDERTNRPKARLFYPDFYLKECGIILEFIGMPDNEEYMRGIERKKKIYEDMGLKVIYVHLDELWEKEGNRYKIRKDFENNLVGKIESEGEKGSNFGLRRAHFHTNVSPFHDYQFSKVSYA